MKAIVLFALFLDLASATCTSALPPMTFDSIGIPENLTVIAQGVFYVSDPVAVVKFKDFKIEGAGSSQGLELAFVPRADFEKLNEKTSLCSKVDAKYRLTPEAGVASVPLEDVLMADVKRDVTESGVYVLLISNCATDVPDKESTISGKVRVQNTHGYLSGIDIDRKRVHGWFAPLYLVVAMAWGYYLFKHRTELSKMHAALSFSLVSSLACSILFFVGLSDCNASGEVGESLRLAECFEMMPPLTLGTCLIQSIIGWGRVPAKESKCASIAMFLVQAIACVSLCLIQDVGQLRQYAFISSSTIYASAAPISLLLAATSIWIGCRVSSNIKQCMKVDNECALRFFKRVSLLSACASVMCFVSLALYIADAPQQAEHVWYYHSLARDLIPQIMLTVFFLMMLMVCAPVGASATFEKLPSAEEGESLTHGPSKLEIEGEYNDEEMFAIEGKTDEETPQGFDKTRAEGPGAMTIGVPLD